MNIFIAKTPYHLLLSNAIAPTLERKEGKPNRNILIYSGSNFNEIKSLLSKNLWKSIHHFDYKNNIFRLNHVRKTRKWINLEHISTDEENSIFYSDDMNWRDQILRHCLGQGKRNLVEDGIGSYYKSNMSMKETLFRHILVRIFLHEIKPYLGSVSQSEASTYYCTDPSAFPWIKNREKIISAREEFDSFISTYCQDKNTSNYAKTNLLILTQPFFESSLLSLKDDINLHRKLILPFANQTSEIIIKKHPREKNSVFQRRVNAIKNDLPKTNVLCETSSLPAEVLFMKIPRTCKVASPASTALINIKKINPKMDVYYLPHSKLRSSEIYSILERFGVIQIT